MRNFFLTPTSIASKVIAVPLLFCVTLSYVLRLGNQTTTDYSLCMAAFGVTAALSAICLTVPSVGDGFQGARYAGEKFLHSSLLLIQTLMIAYVKQSLIASGWWNSHRTLSSVTVMILGIVLALVSVGAAMAWYFGFEAVNGELWSNWDRRLRRIQAQKSQLTASINKESANDAAQQIVGPERR